MKVIKIVMEYKNTITAVVDYHNKNRDYIKNVNVTVTTKDKVVHVLKINANVKNKNV